MRGALTAIGALAGVLGLDFDLYMGAFVPSSTLVCETIKKNKYACLSKRMKFAMTGR
jgi:hypothetical protein